MRHRIIKEERLVLVATNEIHSKIMHFIWEIFSVGQWNTFSVHGVFFGPFLGIPIITTGLEAHVFIKSPVRRFQRNLAPLSNLPRYIACWFENLWDHDLGGGRHDLCALFVVACHASAKSVSAGH